MMAFTLHKTLGLFLLVLQEASSFRVVTSGSSNQSDSNATMNLMQATSSEMTQSGLFGSLPVTEQFDHWQTNGLAGAIDQICCSRTSRRRSTVLVAGLEVYYAGRKMSRGGGSRRRSKDKLCFPLTYDEKIVQVKVEYNDDIHSLQWTTNLGRTSPMCGGGLQGGTAQTVSAPVGKHLMAIYGGSGSAAIGQIGFYWGAGGGSGSWQPVWSCIGCGVGEFKLTECSERATSSGSEVTEEWSSSVSSEMSSGFKFGPISGGSSVTVTGAYAKTTVSRTSSSFHQSACLETTFDCDKHFLWQWTFTSNFDGLGTVATHTAEKVCTDEPSPCCLPGTFTDESGPRNCTLAQYPNTC